MPTTGTLRTFLHGDDLQHVMPLTVETRSDGFLFSGLRICASPVAYVAWPDSRWRSPRSEATSIHKAAALAIRPFVTEHTLIVKAMGELD